VDWLFFWLFLCRISIIKPQDLIYNTTVNVCRQKPDKHPKFVKLQKTVKKMPIAKQKFDRGKLHSKVEEEIIVFLNERKTGAFTSQEIMGGIHYHTDFSTPEISRMSTFAIADFTTLLHDLVRRRSIRMKIVGTRMYYMIIGADLAKCPKCGEAYEPKKTWKMAGRPDKKGQRLQLQIGLYKCPKHGNFRKVLNKTKI